MRVLVTGGCGFVGRHFCRYFLDGDNQVTCVDNLMSESALKPCEEVKNYVFINQDCREYFKSHADNDQWDIVIHLAAVVGGRDTIDNHPLAIADDLSIDAEFFIWLSKLRNKPGKVVYFSSSAAYPVCLQGDSYKRLSEDDIDFEKGFGTPDMVYGYAKLSGEFLAKIAHKKYGIDIVCYRPFSGYGEDQHEVYPFNGILKRVIQKESPVYVWSDCTRDFVHIDDVVSCVVSTMYKVSDGSAINIGTGNGISFTQLATTMCKIANHDAPVEVLSNKPAGVKNRVCDPSFVNSLGWKPCITIEDGIRRALAKH